MLTIRAEQVETFRQYHLRKFEDQMVVHLQEFSPRQWKAIGEPTGRRVIRFGIEQAEKYGFTNHGPVRFYIEMMFNFGLFFDTDPQYPWSSMILTDPGEADQMNRADQLFDVMNDYAAAVSGADHQFTFAALKRLATIRFEDYLKPNDSLEFRIVRMLKEIYPEKCEYMGDQLLSGLLQHGFQLAKFCGSVANRDVALMVLLTFFLGHGCTSDPLHGWIAIILEDHRQSGTGWGDELEAKSRLYSKFILESRVSKS